MFTGLIEDVGEVLSLQRLGKAAKLTVRTNLPLPDLMLGESVAVNGACLTVEQLDPGTDTVIFHTLNETLRKTNLGSLLPGSPVNLERALRVGDRLGGHIVSGHVDVTAALLDVSRRDDDLVVTVALPEEIKELLIPKGSIALNGISLTIAALAEKRFTVHIIPHTWRATNLSTSRSADLVNLEADVVGKYVLRHQQIAGGKSNLSMASLAEAGFV